MQLTNLIVALAISQLALMSLSFMFLQRGKLANLMSLFSLCMIAYLLNQLSVIPGNAVLNYSLNRFSTAMALILWLIAFYLFVDGGKVSTRVWLLMAVFVLARAIGVPLYDPAAESSNFWFILIYFIPQVIVLGFSIHCVYLALHGYALDLLEHRRRARVVFVFGMAILLILSGGNSFFSFVDPFLEQIEFFSIEPLPAIIFPLYIFIFTLGINLTIFRLSDDVFALLPDVAVLSTDEKIVKLQQLKVNSAELEKLSNAMEQDKLYQESGLSIAKLANVLSVQEYQLRRLINQELNYRNFNQFLNRYRIEDSCERLVNTEHDRLSIAAIALDVGYASLSSFNKAFKEIKGVTPSTFRQSGGSADDALSG